MYYMSKNAYDGKVTVWVRRDDRALWESIDDRPQWIHDHLRDEDVDVHNAGFKEIRYKGEPVERDEYVMREFITEAPATPFNAEHIRKRAQQIVEQTKHGIRDA